MTQGFAEENFNHEKLEDLGISRKGNVSDLPEYHVS